MQQDYRFYVGLAIYTFEDLLAKGSAVTQLVDSVQRLAVDSQALRVFRAATVAAQERELVVKPEPVDWDKLKSALEVGSISRFQALDVESTLQAGFGLWIRLDMARINRDRPNHLLLRLPIDCFAATGHQAVRNLLDFGRDAFERLGGNYGYAGIRVTGRSTDVINRVINESIGGLPVGDFFDFNVETSFRSHVKGAFWANYLSRRHIEALGGVEVVAKNAPCHHIERLGGGGLLLVLSPNPLPKDEEEEKARYAQLREFLGPITEWKIPPVLPALEKAGRVQRRSFNT